MRSLNPDLMYFFSLSQNDARVSSEFANDANGYLQKFIAAKQWEKIEEVGPKLTMGMNANKRAADRLKELQKRKRNW